MNEVKTPFLHRKEYASSVRSKSEISRVLWLSWEWEGKVQWVSCRTLCKKMEWKGKGLGYNGEHTTRYRRWERMKCERGMCRAIGISMKTAHLWHLKRLNKTNSKLIDAAPFFGSTALFGGGKCCWRNRKYSVHTLDLTLSLSLLFATNGIGVASEGKLFGVKSWNWKTTVMWREKRNEHW